KKKKEKKQQRNPETEQNHEKQRLVNCLRSRFKITKPQ
ncbi:unnamed protein product, partial [Arabidopsis halleri]